MIIDRKNIMKNKTILCGKNQERFSVIAAGIYSKL